MLVGGQLKCWGTNLGGALGLGLEASIAGSTVKIGDSSGEMGDALDAVSLGDGLSVLEVTGGDKHTCALLNDANGTQGIKCWGHNGSSEKAGALGQPGSSVLGTAPEDMGDNLPWVDLGIVGSWYND